MELSSIVLNKLYGYADESTLVAVEPSPAESSCYRAYELSKVILVSNVTPI